MQVWYQQKYARSYGLCVAAVRSAAPLLLPTGFAGPSSPEPLLAVCTPQCRGFVSQHLLPIWMAYPRVQGSATLGSLNGFF